MTKNDYLKHPLDVRVLLNIDDFFFGNILNIDNIIQNT